MRNSGLNSTFVLRGLGVLALGASLSACSMGNMMGGAPTASANTRDASASPTEIASVNNVMPALATECPPIKVRAGGEAAFSYGKGRVGNARDLNWQAVIDKQSRNCVVSNGKITVQMGVVGRVLLGPAGNQTSVTIPVRFAVERDSVALYSEKYDVPVAITPPDQSAEFVKVVENVQIPYLGGEQIIIWVGFDSAR